MSIKPLTAANSAIHTVNTTFPSISTTKTYRMIKDIGVKHNVCPYLITQPRFCDPNDFCNRDKTPIQKHVLTIYKWFSKFIDDFEDTRISRCLLKNSPFECVNKTIEEVKSHKLANCKEYAVITALILKSKGIKNACTAKITVEDVPRDHIVTVFNKDGSEFNGEIINNKTIIVDSWLGIADYAGNYFSKHRGQCEQFLRIPEGKMGLRDVQKYDFDDAQMEELEIKYPEIFCKN